MGILTAIVASQLALSSAASSPVEVSRDTIVDTVYVEELPVEASRSGIPWNRERFDRDRLLRHSSLDPALSVGYSYSVSFVGGSFGSFAQQTYMAHLAYEFTPDLHLYADLGLWMPLYSNLRFGMPIAKEDLRQGKVDFILPDVALEYKPSENTRVRLMLINENDAVKAYGPHRYYDGSCSPWRNSIFCH